MKELRGNLYANGPMSRDVSFGKPGIRAKAGGRGEHAWPGRCLGGALAPRCGPHQGDSLGSEN